MTYQRDFIDELTDYSEKIRQEHAAIRDEQAMVSMIRYRARLRALHEEVYETELMRGTVSEALRPFLPEPAESQPVALSEAPAHNHMNGHYADVFQDYDEAFDMPNVVRGMAR